MSFVHPALLFGALAFAVPLIIHLLNRQRYKRREWAAMEFLLRAFKKQRRRLRTENLLLLLLRCLIPVVLALAIARPVFRDTIGINLGGSVHHVLVIDQSYSMGLQPPNAESPYVRARDLATELVDRLEGRQGDKVTLVLAGIRTTIPISDDMGLERVKARIAALGRPQDSARDLTEALGQVADLVEDAIDSDLAVYVFTDLQARAFGAAPDSSTTAPEPVAAAPSVPGVAPDRALFADTARDMIERISTHARLRLVDVGDSAEDRVGARVDNLQVVALQIGTPLAVARTAVPVIVTLRNKSAAATSVQVTLDVEGEQPNIKPVRLEAGAEGQVEFVVTFRETGLRHLRAGIDADGLTADNERFLVVNVRDQLRLLLVEGSEETDPDLMDSGHLRRVLDPLLGSDITELSTFGTKVIDTIDFLSGRERLADYHLVVLANVERLNDRAATELKQAMAAGTALWVMLGDRVDAASYNLHLGSNGPMPMQLTTAMGYAAGGAQYYETAITKPDHPIFTEGFVEPIYFQAFEVTQVYRFIGVGDGVVADDRNAEVLARIRDPDLSPLIVTSTFEGAKALFWTSSISRRPDPWNRFGVELLAFPLFHETAKWLALPATDPYNIEIGAQLGATLTGRPRSVGVLLPERAGGGKVPIGDESRALTGGQYTLPPFSDTAYCGIYAVELDLERDGGVTSERLYFAANADPDEGDLTYLSHANVRERLGVQIILRSLPADSSGPIDAGRADLGLMLLYLALAVVLGESVLARFVSRRRA